MFNKFFPEEVSELFLQLKDWILFKLSLNSNSSTNSKLTNILSRLRSIFSGGVGVGLVIILFLNLVYLFQWEDSIWYANDYLELVVPWQKLLIDSGAIFEPNNFLISGLLKELPRGLFPSEFSLETWLFYFFEPIMAILINKILIQLIGYFSALCFLNFFFEKGDKFLISMLSLAWATLGYWPAAGIGSAAYPLVFLIFYKLFKEQSLRISQILFLIFFAFFSHLYLHGFFIGILIFLFGIFYFLKDKMVRTGYWISFLVFVGSYMIFNYRMLDMYFFQRDWFTTHRVEYEYLSFGAYHDNLFEGVSSLVLNGAFHSFLTSPLLFAGILLLIFLNKRKLFFLKPAILTFFGAVFLAFLTMLVKYIPFVELIGLEGFSQFAYDRFSFFVGPLMFFSFSFLILKSDFKINSSYYKKIFLFVLIGYQVLILDNNFKNILVKPITGIGEKYPNFEEFYAKKQFINIKNILDTASQQKGYYVLSLGIHPGVAVFNGLKSLDGYSGSYPLEYKKEFYQIIKDELGEESDENWLYNHFMGWGNKCYLFNQDYGDLFLQTKWNENNPIFFPKYNYQKIREMGGEFILSAYPIVDPNNLLLLQVSEYSNSAWKIYIYKIG
jgi:hypothetical protein